MTTEKTTEKTEKREKWRFRLTIAVLVTPFIISGVTGPWWFFLGCGAFGLIGISYWRMLDRKEGATR